jgi:sterol desaturase/sphingolipid hydroxylase (fatty acid hydroxylase superfamily)
MNVVLYAIPFFFALIAVELIAERVKNTSYYRVNDSINSLTAGVLSQMTGLVKKLIPFTFYVVTYESLQIMQLPQTWWVWLFAFVAYDFLYYWNHRLGHTVNVLWAAHVVHHSSEEYNLTTALRQTSGSIVSFVFYLPLAFLGVDPFILITVGSINLVYQFWVHTRHVPELGWMEWVFVTPSNHRVHHAQNQIYLDKNYGGVFIIWDRLFGSYQRELANEEPIYGVRKALQSWNPVWANLQVYSQLFKDAWRTKSWFDKLRIWFMRTGWRPADVTELYPLAVSDLSTFKKFDVPMSLIAKIYAIIQHFVCVSIGLVVLLNSNSLLVLEFIALIGMVLFASVSLGYFMENKPYAWAIELMKNISIIGALFVLTWHPALEAFIAVACMFSIVLLYADQRANKTLNQDAMQTPKQSSVQ